MKLPPLTFRTLGRVAAGIFLARSSTPSDNCAEIREQNIRLTQTVLELSHKNERLINLLTPSQLRRYTQEELTLTPREMQREGEDRIGDNHD